MIRKITITFSVALVGLMLAACYATHSGTMVNSASLSQNNFKIIGNVTGQAETYTFLMFGGGVGRDALVNEAKQRMYDIQPLKSGQAYANITVDFKNAVYLFLKQTRCTINADVVQFLEDKYYKVDTSDIIMKRQKPFIFGRDTLVNIYSNKNGFRLYEKVEFYKPNNEMVDRNIIWNVLYTETIVEGRIMELNDKGAFIQYSDHITVDKLDITYFVTYDKIKKKK